MKVIIGGIDNWIKANNQQINTAIVCVTENMLGEVARQLIQNGIHTILVEKPGGLNYEDIHKLKSCAEEFRAEVYIGYNRRFYSSIIAAEKIILEDGGVTSFNFEFTEWSHVISGLQKAEGVKEEWFLANSTHVIDLAFYLGGEPQEFCTYTAGGTSWHPRASIYSGAGISKSGALFSYHSNWEAPGRWGLEILTKKNRLIFRPLEKLQIQKIGSIAIEEVQLDNKLDIDFKPGLFRQVDTFLNGNKGELLSINEQINLLEYYEKINKPSKKVNS